MPSFKQTILLVGTPAVLLVGGLSAMAASSPATTTPTQQTEPAAEPAETSDAAEANEPALPGGGHADAAGQNVDHQFQGVE